MNLAFLHPSNDTVFDAPEVPPQMTGELALRELVKNQFLPEPTDGHYNLMLTRTGKEFSKTTPFEALGLQPGDQIVVLYYGRGAADPARLTLDYQVAMAMAGNGVVRSVAAYADSTRAVRVTRPQQAFKARYYEVIFAIKSLIGPGRYHDQFTIAIDLNCSDYPAKLPPCRVVSSPLPWIPRVSQTSHNICTGGMGERDFKNRQFTLGHLILHLAHLLNLDEPPPEDRGLCPDATTYWERHLQLQPITKGLNYPALPTSLLYPSISGPGSRQQPTLTGTIRRKT